MLFQCCDIGGSVGHTFALASMLAAGAVGSAGPAVAAPPVTAKKEGTHIVFRAGEREMFRYHAEPAPLPRPDIKPELQRGAYVFPLLTPSGALVADDYPPNHIHHHGLWWAWTKTTFADTEPDFWNMGQKKGRVEFVALDRIEEKDGAAHLTARHRFVSLLATPPAVVLEETWELAARAIDENRPRHVLDLTSTQICATNQALHLPTYHYGGLGFRGRREWNGARNCQFLTSEGITDRIQGNTSTARWLWIGGQTDTASLAGLTILSHPSNFRAPQPLRLHPTEPFICFAPQQAGPMEIAPGKPYVSRYRLVIADGQPTAEEIEAWWKEFAAVGPTD
ncbi:MAG: PmoA family protein [Verrucomicrobiales bacterium]